MSEHEEYTPKAKTLQEAYEYWVAGLGGSDGHEVERFLEAHERALRENIVRAVEERREHFIAETTLTLGGLPAWTDAYLNGLDDAIDVARGEEQTDE